MGSNGDGSERKLNCPKCPSVQVRYGILNRQHTKERRGNDGRLGNAKDYYRTANEKKCPIVL